MSLEEARGHFVRAAHGVLEHLAAVLMDVMQLFVDRLMARRLLAPAAGQVQVLGSAPLDAVLKAEEPLLPFPRGLEQDGARAVAEDDAGGAVLVIQVARSL